MHTDKKKYDLIFSIGEDCACSDYLRRNNLQIASYPFDWLTAAPFESRIHLLVNDFKDFLNIEDMKILPRSINPIADTHCDYYENTRTKLYFMHDFPIGLPIEETFNEVKAKYSRRIVRLISQIEKANEVLIVWHGRQNLLDDEQILIAYDAIIKRFPCKKIHFNFRK